MVTFVNPEKTSVSIISTYLGIITFGSKLSKLKVLSDFLNSTVGIFEFCFPIK